MCIYVCVCTIWSLHVVLYWSYFYLYFHESQYFMICFYAQAPALSQHIPLSIIIYMRPAKERQLYNVKSSLNDWAYSPNDPWSWHAPQIPQVPAINKPPLVQLMVWYHQRAICCFDVDQDLYRYLASLGQNVRNICLNFLVRYMNGVYDGMMAWECFLHYYPFVPSMDSPQVPQIISANSTYCVALGITKAWYTSAIYKTYTQQYSNTCSLFVRKLAWNRKQRLHLIRETVMNEDSLNAFKCFIIYVNTKVQAVFSTNRCSLCLRYDCYYTRQNSMLVLSHKWHITWLFINRPQH